jgi:FdhE protein
MDASVETGLDFISRAVGEVRKIKPDYGLLLDLYERIFIEQERAQSSMRTPSSRIPGEALAERAGGNLHLVDVSDFEIDGESAAILFEKICAILMEEGDQVAESAERAAGALRAGELNIGEIASALLQGDGDFLSSVGASLGIEVAVLSFILYNSIKPSVHVFSRSLSGFLDTEAECESGCCPVCGSMPELSVFGENGKRSLVCGFCGHQWPSKRVFCVFCGNADHETLRYYQIDNEEEYRVDVCEKCKRYIKTVDVKKTTRPIYLPLENASTPYIDMKFREMGYAAGCSGFGW